MSSGSKVQERSVLVVEDDDLLRKLIINALNKNGFCTDGVACGADAVRYIAANPAVVVLLDQQLPDMTGQEVISQLSMHGIRVSFVVMTGQGDERLAVDMMKFGARDYLVKDNVLVDILPGVMERVFGALESERLLQKAEYALRESEKRFRSLFQDMPAVAVQGYTLDGMVCYWNKASEKLYGFTAEEAIGCSILDLIIPPADRENVKQSFAVMQETGNAIPASELTLNNKQGHELVVFSSFAILRSMDGTPELFSVDVDLTERRRAEQEREHLQSQLLQSQKLESIGRLAGGIAHDFNNVLGVIFGYTDLLLSSLDEADSSYDCLDEIRKAAQRSADLTRQLLAVARRQTAALAVLELNDAVESVLKMLRRLIGEGIDLAWVPGEGTGKVHMDPSQIDQILTNLCLNARDAIQDTGHITIETHRETVDEAFCRAHADAEPGSYAVLQVKDTGCGMSREVQDCLFEPFFTTKPTGKGAGLGLATVYGIVRQNKGFIDVDSESGRGSCLSIYLPCYTGKPPATRLAPAGDDSAAGETIMVVEDNEKLLKMVNMMLERAGFKVLSASAPEQAIAFARDHEGMIDLLLTDVIMPEMNGKALSEEVIAMRPDIKCLFMSGYTDDIIANHDISEETVNFIYKPFGPRALIDKVNAVIHPESAIEP